MESALFVLCVWFIFSALIFKLFLGADIDWLFDFSDGISIGAIIVLILMFPLFLLYKILDFKFKIKRPVDN
jgi:hypothetical protein